MKKKMTLNNKNKYILTVNPGYCCDSIGITRCELEENLIKNIRFDCWDDMAFNAYIQNLETLDKIEFTFNIDDPLYFCLYRLLGKDNKLIIDDDDTYEIMHKYMVIEKIDLNIKITFVNKLKEREYNIERFRIFIKNIGPDPRSKIEDFNTKIRLANFFKDCIETLTEEYHQITIDEFIETKKYNKINNRKKE